MPDITMCEGTECPWKAKCYRHTANPSEFRQSYFAESPGKKVEEIFTCEYFWGEQNDSIYTELKDICNS